MKTVKVKKDEGGEWLEEGLCNKCNSVLLDWEEVDGPCPVCGHMTKNIKKVILE